MSYFSKEFIKFFKELSKNNEREWFHANKKRYETHVKNPFKEFVTLMIDEVQKVDPSVVIAPKDAIFRINRDIRFSKDKTPYKTNVSAAISAGGKKDHSRPGIYFEMGHKNFGIYSGCYMPDKNQLERIRYAMAEEPKQFAIIISSKKFKSMWGEIQGDKNKRIPKEFHEALEIQPLIANKQFYVMAKFDVDKILDPKLPKLIMDYYKSAKPMGDFFMEAIYK